MKSTDARSLLYAALLCALTAVGAFIKIPLPFYPVPLSLQTLFVMMAGVLLTPRYAFLSQFAYVLLGLVGLPIFVGGGGLGYVVQPTFGYLLGFLIGAPVCSALVRRLHGIRFAPLLCSLACCLIINVAGVLYMALVTSRLAGNALSFQAALNMLLLFLPLDAVKAVFSSVLAGSLQKRIQFIQQ